MGIVRGDHLAVGLSFKSIGCFSGGPETLLDAFLEILGPDGTLMVNTFTPLFGQSRLRIAKTDQVFDSSLSPATTGIFAETLRRHPDSLRSSHPTCSVAAIGALARYLTQGHDRKAGAFLPYSRLTEANGKIMSIGIGDKLAGFRHEAQRLAGLLKVVPWKLGCRYVDEQGRVRIFIQKDPPGCVSRLHELVPPMRKSGIVTDGWVGEARSLSVQAKIALNIMIERLRSHPELYLCDNFRCLWCRELERRMDLYGRIEKCRWFQRNPVITLIAVTNWLRLGGNPIVYRVRQLADATGLQLPKKVFR